jgi:hypothetical protein
MSAFRSCAVCGEVETHVLHNGMAVLSGSIELKTNTTTPSGRKCHVYEPGPIIGKADAEDRVKWKKLYDESTARLEAKERIEAEGGPWANCPPGCPCKGPLPHISDREACVTIPAPEPSMVEAVAAFAKAGQWPQGAEGYYGPVGSDLTRCNWVSLSGARCESRTGHAGKHSISATYPIPPLPGPGEPANAVEIATVMQSYLSSNVAMLLFSKLTLYRATGENPEVVVKFRGMKARVSLKRSNGETEHFNRDGEP